FENDGVERIGTVDVFLEAAAQQAGQIAQPSAWLTSSSPAAESRMSRPVCLMCSQKASQRCAALDGFGASSDYGLGSVVAENRCCMVVFKWADMTNNTSKSFGA